MCIVTICVREKVRILRMHLLKNENCDRESQNTESAFLEKMKIVRKQPTYENTCEGSNRLQPPSEQPYTVAKGHLHPKVIISIQNGKKGLNWPRWPKMSQLVKNGPK